MVCHSGPLNFQPLILEYTGIMCEIQIKNMDLVTKIPTLSTADAQRNFVDSSLSLLPVQSIKRAHRERLATCVQARLFNLYRPSAYKNIHCQIPLLTRVAEFPSKLIAMVWKMNRHPILHHLTNKNLVQRSDLLVVNSRQT